MLVSVCSTGRLVACVSPNYQAQFINGEIGKNDIVVTCHIIGQLISVRGFPQSVPIGSTIALISSW